MEISEVRALAKEKMALHGIGHWKLTFVKSMSFAGRCRTRFFHTNPARSSGEIQLSTPYMEVFPYDEVLDTILHEIAHGLVPNDVKSHGPEWKHMASKIGARPERTVSASAPRPKTRYMGSCSGGHEYNRSRATQNMYYTSHYCPTCSTKTRRVYIVWVDTHTNTVLNPSTGLWTPPVDTKPKVELESAAKVAPQPKKELSWKDRFDQGTSSFDDVW